MAVVTDVAGATRLSARRRAGRRRLLLLTSAIVAGSGIGAISPAAAQTGDFPNRALRFVVPFPPGGAVDFVARVVAQEVSTRVGQPVVVDNRPGATGTIGATYVARAPADGYTLLTTAATSYAALAGLPGAGLPFDLEREFAPVAFVGALPMVVAVGPSVPAANLAEFIAYARERPGQLTFSSAGNGSTEHITGEVFMSLAGIRMLHVPYRGGAPAITALIAGEVHVMFATATNILQNGGGGGLRFLAIARPQRSSALPDVPTAAEAGLPGFDVASMYGFIAPAGTPRPIVDRLNEAIVSSVRQPELQARLRQQGIEAVAATPDESAEIIRSELAKWSAAIRAAGITLQ